MENTTPMDVIEIDAASNRKVEDARDILEKVYYLPSIGKNKIYIIDEVHMLTKEAFNTLLKTLGEPPENLIFILATTEAHKVLETIVSRCQKFDFRRITVKDIENRLKYVAKQENINIEDSAIEFIAKKSAGGLRDALALLDQSSVLSVSNEAITKNDIASLLGNISDDDLFELANTIIEKNPQKGILLTKKILDNGNDPMQILKELVEYLRNLLLASICKNTNEAAELLDINPENCEKILSQSKNFNPQELAQILDNLKEQEINIRNSTNPYIWLDVALISVTTRENITAEKSILDRLEALEGRQILNNISKPMPKTPDIEPKREPKKSEQITQPQNTIEQPKEIEETPQPKLKDIKTSLPKEDKPANEIKNTTIEEKQNIEEPKINQSNSNYSWDTFLGMLQKINPVAFALIKPHAKVLEFTPEKIVLGLKNDIFIKQANSKKMFLEQAAKEYFGKIPEFSFRLLSQEDFKKKIAEEVSKSNEEDKNSPVSNSINDIEDNNTDYEESNENYNNPVAEAADFGVSPDLPDDVRNFIDIFGGKIL
jgi:DNA polymerase-3 subunit gamma/tau